MDLLPKEIYNIIINYKSQIEFHEKNKYILDDIKNIKIEYLIPEIEADSGYIIRSVKYKGKVIKNLSNVICFCCGRNIKYTTDEYETERLVMSNQISRDRYIQKQLNQLNKNIINDYNDGRYIKLDEYTDEKYIERASELVEENLEFFIELNNSDVEDIDIEDNEFEIFLADDSEQEEEN